MLLGERGGGQAQSMGIWEALPKSIKNRFKKSHLKGIASVSHRTPYKM